MPPPIKPSTTPYIPYGRHLLDEEDILSVVDVLLSDWLTTGPKVEEFEAAICSLTGARYGVAVSSGTAGLHTAMKAIGIGPGDEVIIPTLTFAATANCILYQRGRPVFADIHPDTLLIDPDSVEQRITPATKAVIAVDYAGHPCDYSSLREIAQHHNLILVADACHSLGGAYKKKKVGTLGDLSVFSFHPVKHITTGEGGLIVTENETWAKNMRMFRNHGISIDHHQRTQQHCWQYDLLTLGYNYRLPDIHCALGISQLKKLSSWLKLRENIARAYMDGLADLNEITLPVVMDDCTHAWHLFVVQVKNTLGRDKAFKMLRNRKIGVNIHYTPLHLYSLYKGKTETGFGLCPVAEKAYQRIMSLPIHQCMSDTDVKKVINEIRALSPIDTIQ